MINKDIYPVTAEFEKEFKDYENHLYGLKKIIQSAKDVLNEYEHGAADVIHCEGVTLKQYKEVISDLIRYMISQE